MHYNWPIIGHTKQLMALESDIRQNTLAGAYLLAGPEKIGKYTIALLMAQMLQCPANFCRQCPSCKQITKNSHFDTIQLRDSGESLKIEPMRDLTLHLNMSVQSPYKVIIIQNIERLTTEAANCLLKTLEEPRPKVVFLLTTNNFPEILPTIISRTRVLHFSTVPDELLSVQLKTLFPDLDADRLNTVIAFSLGKVARAIDLMSDSQKLSDYQRIYDTIQQFFILPGLLGRFKFVEQIITQPAEIDLFLQLLLLVLRKMLLEKVTHHNSGNLDYSTDRLIALIKSVQHTRSLLSHNINAKLALENLLLQF